MMVTFTFNNIRYRKHEMTIELVSKQEKPRVLKVTMGFKITMGEFISTTYPVTLTVDPSGMSTSLRLEGTKEARKVLAEHLERMVEKSHRILADRGDLGLADNVLNKADNVEGSGKVVAKKVGKKGVNAIETSAKAATEKAGGGAQTAPSAPLAPSSSLPECPVCLQDMPPGERIFQVSSSWWFG